MCTLISLHQHSILIEIVSCFSFAGTGNSPAQSSTRSISPNSTSPGQFIHQQLQKSATTASLAGSLTAISSPQQTVCIGLDQNEVFFLSLSCLNSWITICNKDTKSKTQLTFSFAGRKFDGKKKSHKNGLFVLLFKSFSNSYCCIVFFVCFLVFWKKNLLDKNDDQWQKLKIKRDKRTQNQIRQTKIVCTDVNKLISWIVWEWIFFCFIRPPQTSINNKILA